MAGLKDGGGRSSTSSGSGPRSPSYDSAQPKPKRTKHAATPAPNRKKWLTKRPI